ALRRRRSLRRRRIALRLRPDRGVPQDAPGDRSGAHRREPDGSDVRDGYRHHHDRIRPCGRSRCAARTANAGLASFRRGLAHRVSAHLVHAAAVLYGGGIDADRAANPHRVPRRRRAQHQPRSGDRRAPPRFRTSRERRNGPGVPTMTTTATSPSGVLETAHRVRTGSMTARAAVETSLDAVGQIDGTLNCFTTVLRERALAAADAVDAQVRAGRKPGSLAGVPFAVKNLFDIEGVTPIPGSKINAARPPA